MAPRLYLNDTSPYARLVLVSALELGGPEMELTWIDPWANPPDLLAVTPFSMVPVLVTDDGLALRESGLIRDHLALAQAPARALDRSDIDVLLREGLAKNLMDVAFKSASSGRFLAKDQPNLLGDRAREAVARGIAHLEGQLGGRDPSNPDLTDLHLAVALDYCRFRHGDLYEAQAGEVTREWMTAMAERPALERTTPQALASKPNRLSDL